MVTRAGLPLGWRAVKIIGDISTGEWTLRYTRSHGGCVLGRSRS